MLSHWTPPTVRAACLCFSQSAIHAGPHGRPHGLAAGGGAGALLRRLHPGWRHGCVWGSLWLHEVSEGPAGLSGRAHLSWWVCAVVHSVTHWRIFYTFPWLTTSKVCSCQSAFCPLCRSRTCGSGFWLEDQTLHQPPEPERAADPGSHSGWSRKGFHLDGARQDRL